VVMALAIKAIRFIFVFFVDFVASAFDYETHQTPEQLPVLLSCFPWISWQK